MILEKEQIHRYMRHIIMPEIGGAGQKKLLGSSVLVYCKDLHHTAFMLYYLTAMGIGKIDCIADNAEDKQDLQNNLKRLNPDSSFSIVNASSVGSNYDAVILLSKLIDAATVDKTAANTPKILAAAKGETCLVRTVIDDSELSSALNELKDFYSSNTAEESLFYFPAASLAGLLAAIEAVKSILGIGKCFDKPLYINLLDYTFSNSPINQNASISIDKAISDKLRNAKVLIVGSGGLGSPAACMLAQMGIGKLGLVDFDTVDISNLNRQILHSTDRIGMPKVKSAESFLKALNLNLEICTYEQKFSKENAEDLVQDYDIIVDGLDNLPTRYLLNDTCYFLKKPLMEAGVLGFNGLATAIIPDKGPCYRCTFPEIADNGSIPSCSETGVLGAVPGVLGIFEAVEALKQLTGIGSTLLNKLLMFDALNAEFTMLEIYKEDSCRLCGSNPTIDALKDYNFQCKSR